ncbi:MAG TPA: zinc-binding alcohol dehydrogenase family protein, partial [Ktedonobacteraceae bacterium]|nr:zinc-binding alcohol dehydrogenase family protein [Ktedonobacteraceae bacterium]
MKAAVLHHFGDIPRYEDFPDPTPLEEEILARVKAVALENFDRALAKGTHYARRQLLPTLPAIVGTDGIALRDDGQLIGFGGLRPPYGSMAEKAVFPKTHCVPIPEGVDAATAATVPASTLTALFALRCGAKLQPDEAVLIHGATGFAGKLAIQVARLLGAQRVIGTGRSQASLEKLRELGADAVIGLKQSDEALVEAFKQEA